MGAQMGVLAMTTYIKNRVQTLDKVRADLLRLKRIKGTWRAVSVALGAIVPAGTLSAIANGRDPKNPVYRRVLGLPPLDGLAPACSKCGEVHISKRCTTTRKPPTKWADMPPRDVLRALVERHE
jgi:hypothetical protein